MEVLNKRFAEIQATSDAAFAQGRQEIEAKIAKLKAEGKKADKEALEARGAKDKLPEDVRTEIRVGITKAPFGLLLMGIDKLCTNDEDERRLDKFIKENVQWMRISYMADAGKKKLKDLLPMVEEEIGKAKDDDDDVFVLNPEKPEPEFLVAIGTGKAKRKEVKHKNFVFIKDGDTGDFEGENDVVSLGKWMVGLYCGVMLGQPID